MNIKLIRAAILKNIFSIRFLIVLIISFILTYIELHTTNKWDVLGKENFLLYTIVFDGIGRGTGLYLASLPLLASLVGGTLYGQEFRSRRNIFHLARLSKKEYLLSLSIAGFILGGISVITPLLINGLTAWFRLPYFSQNLGQFTIYEKTFFAYSFAVKHPILIILLVILVFFIYGGLFSLLSISISYLYTNIVLEVSGIFIMSFITYLLLQVLALEHFHFYWYLNILAESTSLSIVVSLLMGFITIFIISHWELKQDDLQSNQEKIR